MELKWPLLAIALGVAVVVWLVVWTPAWRRRRREPDAVLVAHAERLRGLPRYRSLVRRRRAGAAFVVVASLVAIAGCAWLAARPQSAELIEPDRRNRDIMLCLDGSRSMDEENAAVLREFSRIAEDLSGDRIGLTVFSGAAITIFPLTDDYEFVQSELENAMESFASGDYEYLAGINPDYQNASQIGDGLVSCTQGFDDLDAQRGRAVVLASDNQPIGEGIFTLDQAADYAAERTVVVHGIGAPELQRMPERRREWTAAMEVTGGGLALLDDEESAGRIVDRIQELERGRVDEPPQRVVHEEPTSPTALAAAGVGLLLIGWTVELAARARRRR